MKRILIVGCGRIGSRHLQSLSCIRNAVEIHVIDNSINSIKNAKSVFENMPPNGLINCVKYYESLEKINFDIDLAIIATNSDVRKRIINELFSGVNVKDLILEKVAFQSVNCFKEIIKLLRTNNSHAWVNCVNRAFPAYKDLKSHISNKGKIYMTVDGGNWEIAGNCIHYLDLFNYLSEREIYNINVDGLDEKVYQSKRPGYIDFNGQITAITIFGDKINLLNDKNNDRPVTLQISNDHLRCIIFEHAGKAILQMKNNSWNWKEISFPIMRQSELTHVISDQIFATGDCDLINLEKSFLIHKPMIEAFNEHLTRIGGEKYKKCPIT